MPNEINAHLRQQASYGQLREYQIVNGKNIRIAIGNKSRNKVYDVPMLALAQKSKNHIHIAWAWFWLAVVGALAIPVYLMIKTHLGLKAHFLDIAILAGLVLAVLLGLSMLVLNFSRKRVYFTEYSGVPLFDILIGKPDNKSFKGFLDVLESHLQKIRSESHLKPEQQIAGEIRMLRRLAAEGVISQKVYEEAKDMMFNLNNKAAQPAAQT